MNYVEIALIAFGIFSIAILLWIFKSYVGSFISVAHPFKRDTSAFPIQDEIPWKRIGGSSVKSIVDPPSNITTSLREPKFKTLRVSVEQIREAKWTFRIRFVFINTLQETICIDDMHVRAYVRYAPHPPYGTVSWRGEVLLMADNSIWKDEDRSYSLDPSKGYEMELVLEMTRQEGAPIYGDMVETAGEVLAVFGLLIDYYTVPEVDRRVLPSDSVYLFRSRYGPGVLEAIDAEKIKTLPQSTNEGLNADSLESLLKEHLSFRPIPKS